MSFWHMIENRPQPKTSGIGIRHESDISAIFAVLANGVGMTNHPQKYKKSTNGLVRSNTGEKQKNMFSDGVGARDMHKALFRRPGPHIPTLPSPPAQPSPTHELT